jgi:hypothetical protein
VTLDDAVKHAARMELSGLDKVAVHVLAEAGKRILKMKRPIRELAEAISPDANLNQVGLLGGDKGDGS